MAAGGGQVIGEDSDVVTCPTARAARDVLVAAATVGSSEA